MACILRCVRVLTATLAVAHLPAGSAGELLLRDLLAGSRHVFGKFDPVPNGKTDTNNSGSFSTDNIGMNYDYPEGSYERRREIVAEHAAYQQGYMWFLTHDPRVGEVENLLVPVAISASHIAYGSIRMEPVFMILGQSAATAAVLAIDGALSVQEVPYAALKPQLVADGQVIEVSPARP